MKKEEKPNSKLKKVQLKLRKIVWGGDELSYDTMGESMFLINFFWL